MQPAVELPPPSFRRAILGWYDQHGRRLPFRGTHDPWAVLVSEVMAQQTQISRVGPAWQAFMARFPGPAELAAASGADVIRAWSGLGYNRRAVALRRCAQEVVARHAGRLPAEVARLQALPGIGPYTARAVAAIAFGLPEAPVDVNVRRVVGRVVGGTPGLPPARLQEVADALVPRSRPADWTHALMDVGARFCRPRAPRCDECPARRWCAAARAGFTDAHAVNRPRARGRVSFEGTSRWLRGRLLARLAAAGAGAWTDVGAPLGTHDLAAVLGAVESLAHEGLLERHPEQPNLARLPVA